MNRITIAHLSDIHHNPGDTSQLSTLLKEKQLFVEKHLEICLRVLAERQPDLVAVTGDLTHEGSADAYRYLREQFDRFLPGTPVLCSMGNHDIRRAFREGFLGEAADGPEADAPYFASVSVRGFRFISLDSAWKNGLEGVLDDDALDYLESQLVKPPACGAFLLLHHPVMDAAKSMGLTMSERLAEILQSGKIRGIFNGHVHGSYTGTVYGVPQFTADSLKTGCDLRSDTLAYNDRAGYEIVTFDAKGDWLTERFLIRPEAETFFTKEF